MTPRDHHQCHQHHRTKATLRRSGHSVPDGNLAFFFLYLFDFCPGAALLLPPTAGPRPSPSLTSLFERCIMTLGHSLIVFRGPRISNTPAAALSPPNAMSSSMRAESDGGILDTVYDAADSVDGVDKALLPHFHNFTTRSSSSNEHLNFMASHMQPDARIPMVTCLPFIWYRYISLNLTSITLASCFVT